MLNALLGEWRELGSRDIDHRTQGAKVRARETIESKPSADEGTKKSYKRSGAML
jgi:hypothetical protein